MEIMQEKKPWAVSSSENPVRANGGKSIALMFMMLVQELIPHFH